MTPAKVDSVVTAEQKIEELKTKMASIQTSFLEDIESFVDEWLIETAKSVIDKFPEIEKKYSYSEIDNIVLECEELSAEIASEFKDDLSRSELWWHKNELISKRDQYKLIDNIVSDSSRFILGRIGIVLNKYGFLPKMVKPFHGFISEKDGSNNYIFKYIDPIYWSRDMKTTFDNYWELYKYALRLKNS